MRKLIVLLLIGASANCLSQENKLVDVYPILNGKRLVFNSNYILNSNDTISISKLAFYISNVNFYNNDSLVYTEKESFHLVNFNSPRSLNYLQEGLSDQFVLKVDSLINFNEIRYVIGVDSLTNSNGIGPDDLDPTKGMYWSWQTGYINFKLEGKSSASTTRKNKFWFHLGGFQNGNDCTVQIKKKTSGLNLKKISISINLNEIFGALDLRSQTNIMSPGAKAKAFSKLLKNTFK